MGELERKYDVKIETTEEKVKFPDELKANLKETNQQTNLKTNTNQKAKSKIKNQKTKQQKT